MIYDYLHQFFFGYYPYIVLTVLVVGVILRYDNNQYALWKAGSSQLLRKKGVYLGSNLFHIGIILLFFGHLIGLLTPHWVYSYFMDAATKQLLAIIAGGIFGGICFIGMTILLIRRLFYARVRVTSKVSDTLVLIVLYVQLILGLISILYSLESSDGSSMVALASWAQYIVTFQGGAADLILHESLIFKLHIVLGLTIFLIFPFTRLVHMLSGVSAMFRYIFRSGYQIVRKRG